MPDEEFSNKELQQIQQGREEAREGKAHTWKEVFGEEGGNPDTQEAGANESKQEARQR